MNLDATLRRAMIVAHPDDETLWGGGLLLRHPGDWTVIACSIPARDPERAAKFHIACDRLGARGIVRPYVEQEQLAGLEAIDLEPYALLVTHGAAGEYGHEHHKQVHRHVMLRAGDRPVITFGYFSGREVLSLTPDERVRKLHALRAYDHQSSSDRLPKWRALLDRYGEGWLNVETFDG